jgi:hypothetical protein
MRVNVQIALGLDFQIDDGVPREQFQHVIQESNTGLRSALTLAIEA